jgi:hypothetical protein
MDAVIQLCSVLGLQEKRNGKAGVKSAKSKCSEKALEVLNRHALQIIQGRPISLQVGEGLHVSIP